MNSKAFYSEKLQRTIQPSDSNVSRLWTSFSHKSGPKGANNRTRPSSAASLVAAVIVCISSAAVLSSAPHRLAVTKDMHDREAPAVERFWASGIEIDAANGKVPGSSEMNAKDAKLCSDVAARLRGGQGFTRKYDEYGASILPTGLVADSWSAADPADYRALKHVPCASVHLSKSAGSECSVDRKTELNTDDGGLVTVISSVKSGVAGLDGPIASLFFQDRRLPGFQKGDSEIAAPTPITVDKQRLVASWGRREFSFDSDGSHPKALRRPVLTVDVGRVGPAGLIEPLLGKVCEVSLTVSYDSL